jgi:hypothetical protein
MKSELREALDRQAAWQRSRARESWAEKLRRALILRDAMLALREAPVAPPLADPDTRRFTSAGGRGDSEGP